MTQAKTIFYHKDKHIEPAFEGKSFPIVMAMDDGYAKVCAVSLVSLADNVADSSKYDIVVLESRLSDENKEILTQLVAHKDNISLRFYNIEECIAPYRALFFNQPNFTIEAYYRFFIVPLFEKFSRVLYLDVDTVIESDLTELFGIDLNQKCLGAVRDVHTSLSKSDIQHTSQLGIVNAEDYFNSGLILFDIHAFNGQAFLKECMETLQRLGEPKKQDQDVLNVVLQGKLLYLDKKWNYYSLPPREGLYLQSTFENAYKKRLELIECKGEALPRIIHFIGRKPWQVLQTPFAERFWFYAEKTPFFAEFVRLLLAESPKRMDYALKKRKSYALKSKLPFGKWQEKWKWKWDAYNYEVLALERFLKKHGKSWQIA